MANRRDEFAPPHEPPFQGLGHRLLELLLARRAGRDVEERPERGRDSEPDPLLDIRRRQGRLVKDAARRRLLAESRRYGEVDLVREELRQIVEDQGRLVRHDGLRFVGPVSAPERKPDEILVLRRRHVGEPVEPVLDPLERPGREVVFEVRDSRNPTFSPALR